MKKKKLLIPLIIGGNLAAAGDYVMLPLKSATNKYSMNLVYKDTSFRLSQMGADAGALGVAMLIRDKSPIILSSKHNGDMFYNLNVGDKITVTINTKTKAASVVINGN